MDKKLPSGMLVKLAEYEAQGLQTGPLYDEWSRSYETDLIANFGYSAHEIAAAAFAANSPDRPDPIIDVGCGTGLVGQELARLGFANIDGLDISAGMIAEARLKGIYRRLIAGDLTASATVPSAAYAAAICVGSFGPGHLGPEGFEAIVRLVRPGGLVVIFLNGRHFVDYGYGEEIRRLEALSVWSVAEIKSFNYMKALDRPGRLIIARRFAGND